MDWKLAKNYTIIFLLILNIILFVANFINDNQYKVSQGQRTAIVSYLAKNDISIYSDLPSKYYPMQQLKVKLVDYDYIKLQDIFFRNSSNIKRTEIFSNTIFSNGSETLTILEDYIFFKDESQIENFNYSKENLIKICDEYVKNMNKYYTNFSFDRSVESSDYFLFEYSESVGNYKIFNNYAIFKMYKDGTKEIYFYNLVKDSFFGDKVNIVSIDEALYVFSREIRKIYSNVSISIKQVDLGYFTSDFYSESQYFSLTPYYRFYIAGVEKPFYVNAYTNTFFGE